VCSSDLWGTGNSYLEIINRSRGLSYTPDAWISEVRQKIGRLYFPRECELKADGDNTSYFPWTTIKPAIVPSLPMPIDLTRPANEQDIRHDSVWSARAGEQVAQLLAQMDTAVADGGVLCVGCDVGRTTDKFCLLVGRRVQERVAVVATIRWRGMKFRDMQAAGDAVMRHRTPSRGRVHRMVSDRTGLGMQMAEHWEDTFPRRCEGLDFNNTNKEVIATNARSMFDMSFVSIPDDHALHASINGIRETRTAGNKPRYMGERTADGHADDFWALAAMLHAADSAKQASARAVTVTGGLA